MPVINQGTETDEPARSNLPAPTSGERFQEFNVIPRQLLFHSLVWQLLLALPLLSFFVLLMLGWHQEPSEDAAVGKTLSQRLQILHMWCALFFSAALFSCLGSLVSYVGRDHPQ